LLGQLQTRDGDGAAREMEDHLTRPRQAAGHPRRQPGECGFAPQYGRKAAREGIPEMKDR
jgi:hypothetical protein